MHRLLKLATSADSSEAREEFLLEEFFIVRLRFMHANNFLFSGLESNYD